MRPNKLKTRIFLDSGDPEETRGAVELLCFLDGQTTNPTLLSKNPQAKERFERGDRFTKQEIFDFYKDVVAEISGLIPDGSVSIEVYADKTTRADELFKQGAEMFTWIPNAHIKYPATTEGLTAAEQSVHDGLRVNMTLVFSQAQAAAVYAVTRKAQEGGVFVSPFIGRLDDIGMSGMDLIKNVLRMYAAGDGHVELLTASVRSMEHFLYALALGSDIITAPLSILKEWARRGMPVSSKEYAYDARGLAPIPFEEHDLSKDWKSYDIQHDLTDKGIQRFSDDWNKLLR